MGWWERIFVIEYDRVGLLPKNFSNYFEPFLGGGAIYFYLWRKKKIKNRAYLSDINSELINVYQIIRDHVNDLLSELEKLKNKYSKEDYYEHRKASVSYTHMTLPTICSV